MLEKKQKVDFEPLDIIYKPVKCIDEIIECYFTAEINLAFRAHFQRGNNDKNLASKTAFHCYYCSTFVCGKPKFENHLAVCA